MTGRDPASTAVLVASCDRYRDLWRPFFTLFFRYWPDCPYPLYLGTNFARYDDARIENVAVGADLDWSHGFRAMLERVPHRFVIVLLEDYLLSAPVDTPRLARLLDYMARRDAAALRLAPVPGAETACTDFTEVGELHRGMPYRLSLQAAAWDRRALLTLVRDGESPWQLELEGSARTDKLEQPFLSVLPSEPWVIPYFCTAVVRGKWLRDALALCRRERVPVDLAARESEGVLPYTRRRYGGRIRSALA